MCSSHADAKNEVYILTLPRYTLYRGWRPVPGRRSCCPQLCNVTAGSVVLRLDQQYSAALRATCNPERASVVQGASKFCGGGRPAACLPRYRKLKLMACASNEHDATRTAVATTATVATAACLYPGRCSSPAVQAALPWAAWQQHAASSGRERTSQNLKVWEMALWSSDDPQRWEEQLVGYSQAVAGLGRVSKEGASLTELDRCVYNESFRTGCWLECPLTAASQLHGTGARAWRRPTSLPACLSSQRDLNCSEPWQPCRSADGSMTSCRQSCLASLPSSRRRSLCSW